MRTWPLPDPERFFAERTPGLWSGVAVAVAGGVAAVSTGIPYAGRVLSVDPTPAQLAAAAVLGGLIGVIPTLLVYAALVYAAAAVSDGAGSFRRNTANVAWSQFPLAAANVVYAAFAWAWVLSGGAPVTANGLPRQPDWLAAVSTAVTVLGHLGVAYVLWYGVRDAHDVTTRRAAVIAVLTTTVAVAWVFV